MSLQDFKDALAKSLYGETKPGCCVQCKQEFKMGENVFTDAGMRETKISKLCEKCWDEMFKE